MRKIKKLNLSVLNIVLHPHTHNKYIELLKEAFSCAKSIKIRGQYYGLPISIKEINEEEGYILGKFYRYTEIDKSKPWLDVNNASLILDDDGKAIPQVDDSKKPNSTEIFFVFLIRNHRLVYESNLISPNSIKDFFTNLFSQIKFTSIKNNEITINIEQSHESIEEILKMYTINDLIIKIHKPNPDDISSMEDRIQTLLNNVQADEYKEEYTTKNKTIVPDKDIKQKMLVAKSNGSVYAKGISIDGKIIKESTDEHPLIETKEYNTDNFTYIDALKNLSIIVVDNIMEKLRNVN